MLSIYFLIVLVFINGHLDVVGTFFSVYGILVVKKAFAFLKLMYIAIPIYLMTIVFAEIGYLRYGNHFVTVYSR